MTYRLRAQGTLPGETFSFGLHVDGAGGDSAAALTAWTTAIGDFWNDVTDGVKSLFTADVVITGLDAAELDPVTGKQLSRSETGTTLTGTAAGEMLPHEVALVVSMRTALATRSGRGRFYLPPLAVSKVDGGLVLAAAALQAVNGAALLVNTLQGAAYNPVILHPDQSTTPVNKVDVGNVFDVQRRRRNKLLEERQTVGV